MQTVTPSPHAHTSLLGYIDRDAATEANITTAAEGEAQATTRTTLSPVMDFSPEEAVPLVLEKGTTFPIKKGAYGATDAEATWKHVEASVVAGIKRRGFKGRLVVKTRKMKNGESPKLLLAVRRASD